MNCKRLSAGVAAAIAMLCGGSAAGQEIIPFQLTRDANMVGLGVFSVPDYYGSDDYEARVAPIIRYNFNETMYAQLVGPEARVNVVPYRTDVRAGPLLRVRQRRDHEVSDEVVKRMEPIPADTEIGAFLDYHYQIDPSNPLHKVVFSADMAGNTTGVYSGLTGNIRATYYYPFQQGIMGYPLLGTVGFGLFFASDHFAEKYFGVGGSRNLAQFPRLNERAYRAQGGLLSIKVPFSLITQVDPKWLVTVAGRYERLLNDAADSPVVKNRGDENQWIIGIAGIYLF